MSKRHDVGAGQRVIRVVNTRTGLQELVIVDPNAPANLPQTRAVAPYRQDFAPHDRIPYPQYSQMGAERRGPSPQGRKSGLAGRVVSLVLFAAAVPAVHYGAEVGAYKSGAAGICWAKQNPVANVAINTLMPKSDVLCTPPAEPTRGISSISSIVVPSVVAVESREVAIPLQVNESEVW
ncbi:hypothetical protein IPP75_01795 [Candidatus Saccharibacteria bacterium]|nr:MAG: hypothetical protein IPP75_01795 [Candidatus Saccharibacteria bacterium]